MQSYAQLSIKNNTICISHTLTYHLPYIPCVAVTPLRNLTVSVWGSSGHWRLGGHQFLVSDLFYNYYYYFSFFIFYLLNYIEATVTILASLLYLITTYYFYLICVILFCIFFFMYNPRWKFNQSVWLSSQQFTRRLSIF